MSTKLELPLRGSGIADADLLIDTGAELSVLQPSVLNSLGLTVADLRGAPAEVHLGATGVARFARVRTRVTMGHDDGASVTYTLFMRVPLDLSEQTSVPSLLGMDFLGDFELRISKRLGLVEVHAPM